jgi:hypothetical protein
MYHTIEFCVDFTVDLQISRKQPLERLRLHKGTRCQAQIKPFVAESMNGPVEVADLHFGDGTVALMVPFACFSFVD